MSKVSFIMFRDINRSKIRTRLHFDVIPLWTTRLCSESMQPLFKPMRYQEQISLH